MRLLDKSNTALGLDKLITHAPVLALVRAMIAQPDGIIYVTGPTGSGKTTTLYSALAEINDPGVNISTAEYLIEYDLPGVTQIQVAADIGLTFAGVLRVSPSGSRRAPRGRDARQGDGAHGRGVHPAARDGHRAFSGLVIDDWRHRPAADAASLPPVQGADPCGREHRPILRVAGGHDHLIEGLGAMSAAGRASRGALASTRS